MKPFIVSMGIIILGVTGLVFRSDLTRYTVLQENLQALSEECAAYAALACEEDDDRGIVFNELDAENRIEYLVTYAQNNMPCFQDGCIIATSPVFYENGYSVSVHLDFVSNSDLFRLALIKMTSIGHTSCYEWVEIPQESPKSGSFLLFFLGFCWYL